MGVALGIFDIQMYVEAFHCVSKEKYKTIGFTSVQAAEKVQ